VKSTKAITRYFTVLILPSSDSNIAVEIANLINNAGCVLRITEITVIVLLICMSPSEIGF
jgi:hypothetical protein